MKIPTTLVEYPSKESVANIHQFLQTHPAGVLAEVGEGGWPHASVIYFIVDRNFGIYFATKTNTKKYQNLSNDPHVMLVAFHQSTQATAQIKGSVVEVSDPATSRSIVDKIEDVARQYSISGVAPILKLDTGDYVAYELKPDTIKFAMFLRPDPVTYDTYETLVFRRD